MNKRLQAQCNKIEGSPADSHRGYHWPMTEASNQSKLCGPIFVDFYMFFMLVLYMFFMLVLYMLFIYSFYIFFFKSPAEQHEVRTSGYGYKKILFLI